ncbi:T9SS type A sorting domain-containing protein [candidate division WOR-3 bacterium]|nr:T9SS type A sorting domain-containing protein [candidate division WOR-3 bacterium]
MLKRWVMAVGLISALLLSGAEQDDVPLLRWAGPPGTRPGTYREWIALHPYTDFSYSLDKRVTGDGKAGTVAIITEQSIAPSLTAEISQLITNLQLEGYTVKSYGVSGGTPDHLRSLLRALHTTDNIEGALLIGNLPIAWFQVKNDFDVFGYQEWPVDFYYMDLDGSWYDSLKYDPVDTLVPGQDGIYDGHSGHLAPEIYIGRLLPTGIGDDTLLLQNYFYKNNAFRQGTIELQHKALVYVDDDWFPWAPWWAADVALLYSNTLVVYDSNTTRASDYRVRLDTVRAWVSVFAHSWPDAHVFDYNNQTQKDYYYSIEYTSQNPPANFYNFFACSFARYTEAGYGGGHSIFNASYGVGSIGSTKIGSMLDFHAFYLPLSQGKTIGEAFRDWFIHIASDGITFMELCWHYGMTLLGDPFLRPTGHTDIAISERDIPFVYYLSQNHPNPFSAKTVIKFTVNGSQFTGKNRQLSTVNCQLNIYDIAGRLVRTLVDERKRPGHYLVKWDGRDDSGRKVVSGVYFYRLTAGEFVKTQKMVRIQ